MGEDNFFLFGLTAAQVEETKRNGYNPYSIYENNSELNEVINLINSGILADGNKDLFKPITEHLLRYDSYLLFADYSLYIACQELVSETWKDTSKWDHMAILNVARMGKFSSDRSIQDYCDNIWKVKPFRIK